MLDLPTIQLIRRPGIIELGWGHPNAALLPVDGMRQAAADALDRWGADALNYGADQGAGPLLAWLTDRIARTESRAPAIDEIMITGGVSHALDQICTLCTQPGDIALVESPTYHLAIRILRDHPLELIAVPADEHGLQVDALAATLAELRRAGRRARLLYCVPTFHNPTGASLQAERRAALVELAAAEQLLIVEDDVYRELSYDGPALPSLWSLAAPDTVVRLGSFAKSLAPGVRLGWLTAGPTIAGRLIGSGLLDSGGGVNHFTSLIVAAFCASGQYDQQITQLRAAYRIRRDALLAGLGAHLPPGCTWTTPGGGFFVWVRLPEGMDAAALLPRAEAAGVAYLPGARFHTGGGGANTLRLAFSLYDPDELVEAARRLGGVIREEVESAADEL
ncbi:MAG: PLP-dependent aminotransferase family protein [Chloroflexota bacterium]|nr:PLP-dependent aminotransferase family protein [Chloroflexota bacterium]